MNKEYQIYNVKENELTIGNGVGSIVVDRNLLAEMGKILGMEVLPHEDYKDLLVDRDTLYALEAGGVDNWNYYGDAINDYCNEAGFETIEEMVENYLK
jgi:hypothetical protein